MSLATRPAASAAQRLPSATAPVVTAPQGLAVAATNGGPQLTWQKSAAAASYQVLRAANASSPTSMIARLAPTVLSYLDRGFNAAAVYRIVAVAADGRAAASAPVSYAPPLLTATVVGALASTATVPQPTITSVGGVAAGLTVTLGDTVPVRGTNFGTISRALLVTGCYYPGAPFTTCHGRPCYQATACRPDSYGSSAVVTTLAASATGFSFVVPLGLPINLNSDATSYSNSIAPGTALPDKYFLVVQFNAGRADTSWALAVRTRP